jgi:hypothetical protein
MVGASYLRDENSYCPLLQSYWSRWCGSNSGGYSVSILNIPAVLLNEIFMVVLSIHRQMPLQCVEIGHKILIRWPLMVTFQSCPVPCTLCIWNSVSLTNDWSWKVLSKIYVYCVRFEVFTVVAMKNGISRDVTLCGSCKNQRIGGT